MQSRYGMGAEMVPVDRGYGAFSVCPVRRGDCRSTLFLSAFGKAWIDLFRRKYRSSSSYVAASYFHAYDSQAVIAVSFSARVDRSRAANTGKRDSELLWRATNPGSAISVWLANLLGRPQSGARRRNPVFRTGSPGFWSQQDLRRGCFNRPLIDKLGN